MLTQSAIETIWVPGMALLGKEASDVITSAAHMKGTQKKMLRIGSTCGVAVFAATSVSVFSTQPSGIGIVVVILLLGGLAIIIKDGKHVLDLLDVPSNDVDYMAVINSNI